MTEVSLGRAEYQTTIDDCFESVPASYILKEALNPEHVGMVVGDRGSGKTHLLRLLAKEIPLDIYVLDKESINEGTIRYSRSIVSESPKITVVDDLHYLLKTMQLTSYGDNPISEEEVVDKLYGFKEESKRLGSQLIFVSDDGPAGLSMRFQDQEQKARLMRLLEGCVDTGDDSTIFGNVIGKYQYTEQQYVVNLNRRGLKRFFNKRFKQTRQNILRDLNMKDIPFVYFDLHNDYDKILYEFDEERNIVPGKEWGYDEAVVYPIFSPEIKIASIRELVVVTSDLGEISRKSLKLDIGELFSNGLLYSKKEIAKIQKRIKRVYSTVSGTQNELFKVLSDPEVNEDMLHAAILKHQLRLE